MGKWWFGWFLAFGACMGNAQELVLRHGLEGRALDALSTLTLEFNELQKGKGRIVLQGLAGVEDKRKLPNLAILHPDDALTFFDTLPRYLPLSKVMAEGGEKLDAKRIYPQISDAMDDSAGRLVALPIGLSLPVLMWHRDLFAKAGLDPEAPPKTWWDVQRAAGALFDAGIKCPLTSSRFAWVHVENTSTQHNEQVEVKPNRVTLNNMVNVKHLALLASWQKSFYFHYYGGGGEANARFLAGQCAMLTGESSLYAQVLERKLNVGIAALPYYDDVYGATPANIVPQGAGLWFLAGMKKPELKLAASFASFMLKPQNQKLWVKTTGYLPMTPDALQALRESGIPVKLLDALEKRLSAPKYAHPRADGPWERLHQVLGEEVEAVWRDEKPAKAALDTAMSRVNVPAKTR